MNAAILDSIPAFWSFAISSMYKKINHIGSLIEFLPCGIENNIVDIGILVFFLRNGWLGMSYAILHCRSYNRS